MEGILLYCHFYVQSSFVKKNLRKSFHEQPVPYLRFRQHLLFQTETDKARNFMRGLQRLFHYPSKNLLLTYITFTFRLKYYFMS